jgi:nucleoid-associated protein YgaU
MRTLILALSMLLASCGSGDVPPEMRVVPEAVSVVHLTKIAVTASPELTYEVRKGDNLWKLAPGTTNLAKATWAQKISKLNKLKDPNKIYPKQILLLPSALSGGS